MYLFIYLGLLILYFVIKVSNENVLKLCVLVRSHWYYEVFIYMISASYFLGKVAPQGGCSGFQVTGMIEGFFWERKFGLGSLIWVGIFLGY